MAHRKPNRRAGDAAARKVISQKNGLPISETAATTQALPLDQIRVGERIRRDMGDIAALAASIADIGLINAITVDEKGRLLAGARRLAACKLLGLQSVKVDIVRCDDEA